MQVRRKICISCFAQHSSAVGSRPFVYKAMTAAAHLVMVSLVCVCGRYKGAVIAAVRLVLNSQDSVISVTTCHA